VVLRDSPQAPSLRKQAFSGVRWTTFSAGVKLVLQVAQVVVLARLLAPADFGLMAMVASILAFVQIFTDVGVSNAIIHYQEIDETQLSSLYWLNVGASVVLALIVAAMSPLVAWFYGQEAIQPLLVLAGASLVVVAAGQQIRVVAQKRLAFAALAAVDIPAYSAGFAVAVIAAFAGAGVYSLIFGTLATVVTGTVLLWVFLSKGWRPKLVLNLSGIGVFLRFGAYMIGNNVVGTINSQVDIVMGGRILGADAIGMYSVPKSLSLRVSQAVNPIVTLVGMPVMAKAQGDGGLLRNVYLQTIRMVASANFPVYTVMGLFAPELVRVLLGEKWTDAATLLQVFAWWGLMRSIGNPVGSLLMAVGKADLSFKWNIVWLFITPPAVWVGSLYGTVGMALAMFAVVAAGFVPNWYFLVRSQCGAKFGEYLVQIAVPLALSAAAGFVGIAAAYPFHAAVVRLAVGAATVGVVYLVLSYLFNRVWFGAMGELLGLRLGAPPDARGK
jgi:lipopolysaccharide exporter